MRILNKKTDGVPHDAVYVGRPTPFGNRFVIGKDGNRKQVIAKYREWLYTQPQLIQAAREQLKGKSLVCWCYPLSCHAEVLMEVANQCDFELD